MNSLLNKLKYIWPFLIAAVTILSWVISQAVTVSEVQHQVDRNTSNVEEVEEIVKEHKKEGSHPKINEKLIKLESDVSHIRTNQSDNYNYIKDTLNIIQQDIKDINKRPRRNR